MDARPSDTSRSCAVQQPHLFPRWDIVLRMFVSDVVVPLTRVQFVQRQFHNRCRIAPRLQPHELRWCTIPVSLPEGRSTLISDVVVHDPAFVADKTLSTLEHCYRRTPGWPDVQSLVEEVCLLIRQGSLAPATTASMCGLLTLLGWSGYVCKREATYQTERNVRLARLTRDAGCDAYHCGPLGVPFLCPSVFHEHRITPVVLATREAAATVRASDMESRSALDLVCRWGLDRVRTEMQRTAESVLSTRDRRAPA